MTTTTTTAPKISKKAQEEQERRDWIKKVHPNIYKATLEIEEKAAKLQFDPHTIYRSEGATLRGFIGRLWRGAYLAATGGVKSWYGDHYEVQTPHAEGGHYAVTKCSCDCPDRPPRVSGHSGKFCKHSLAVIIKERADSLPAPAPAEDNEPLTREFLEAMNPAARHQRILRERAGEAAPLSPEKAAEYANYLEIDRDQRRAAYRRTRV